MPVTSAFGNSLLDLLDTFAPLTSPAPLGNLVAGVASCGGATTSGILLQATAPSGGSGTYSYLWSRTPHGTNAWANLNVTLRNGTDTNAVAGTSYDYRLQVTDTSTQVTTTTNSFVAYLYQGGATSGASVVSSTVGCSFIRGL